MTVMATDGVNCVWIAGEHYLRADMRERCPIDDPSSATFVWTVIMLILYPFGIPFFLLFAMKIKNVPFYAKRKLQNRILQELIVKYKEGVRAVWRRLAHRGPPRALPRRDWHPRRPCRGARGARREIRQRRPWRAALE